MIRDIVQSHPLGAAFFCLCLFTLLMASVEPTDSPPKRRRP